MSFRAADLIAGISRLLGMAAVLAMLVSVNIEVVGRSFFGHATIWVTEVSTYLVVAMTFLGAAHAARRDAHIRVDLVLDRLPPEFARHMRQATIWIAVLVTLVALWKVSAFVAENFSSGARSWSLLNMPLWIPQGAAVAGLTGLTLVLLFAPGTRPESPGPPSAAAVAPALAALAVVLLHGLGLMPWVMDSHAAIAAIAALVAMSAFMASGAAAFVLSLAVTGVVALLFSATSGASLPVQAAVLTGVLFLLLLGGLPVVFSLLGIGIAAMVFWLPAVSLDYIGERAWGAVNTFELAAIPMFVLMGAILVRSNASAQMFRAARVGLGRVPGGLAHASILASGIFAAVSGSSLATAATMGRVAGPEMMTEGYRPQLAYGVLAAGGTLGILIPPSIAMIVYGPLAGVPVTDLFLAGILPGLLMIAAFAAVVVVWVAVDPKAAPPGRRCGWREKFAALKGILPFVALMALVLGSLYLGIATPTEAGAVGVVGAMAVSVARGTFSLADFAAALEEAALVTSFLLMIAVGAAVMGFGIDFLSMPRALVELVDSLDLTDFGLFVAIVVLYLMLGMFIEPISMVLMTLPVLLPVIAAAGWDPLWFGIVLVMLVEIGLITPPVGMILYVLSGVAGDRVSLGHIASGTLPFVAAFLAMIFVFFMLPGLVTVLPELAR